MRVCFPFTLTITYDIQTIIPLIIRTFSIYGCVHLVNGKTITISIGDYCQLSKMQLQLRVLHAAGLVINSLRKSILPQLLLCPNKSWSRHVLGIDQGNWLVSGETITIYKQQIIIAKYKGCGCSSGCFMQEVSRLVPGSCDGARKSIATKSWAHVFSLIQGNSITPVDQKIQASTHRVTVSSERPWIEKQSMSW